MVRSEDPPGTQKHLRFGKISPEIYQALSKVPGVKSIVQHAGGSKGGTFKEHPHYHVWYESDTPITNQTVRNRLAKLPEFATHKGQNDWSFRNHDSWETWAAYVCKNKTHKVLLSYRDLTDMSEFVMSQPVIEHITHDEAVKAEVAVIKQRDSRAQRYKLKDHLIEVWNWKENAQFTLSQYTSAKAMCKSRIVDWFSGWLDDRDGIRMLRFLLYTFSDDELRSELTFKISDSWDKYV